MDEICLSWEDCVKKAYERYEYVLARKKIGALPHRKRQITDYMVEFTAKTMEEQKKLHFKLKDSYRDLRGRAIATAEETKAVADAAKLLWEDISEDLWNEVEEIWKP